MTLLLSLLGNKYVLVVIAIVAALMGLWGYGALQHSRGYDQAVIERHTADLESFKVESERLQGLSASLEAQLASIRDAKPKIIERYVNAAAKNPLPTDCRIDPDRLLNINAAIQTINTGKSSITLPASK
jgi:hypothetical protein